MSERDMCELRFDTFWCAPRALGHNARVDVRDSLSCVTN